MIDGAEGIGLAAASLTTIAFLPQALKVWRSRSAADISLAMFLLFLTGVGLWMAYGLLIGSLPVFLGNLVTFLFAMAILVAKLKFG
ncbi:MAG: SemiSWEET family sugar transporter [Alphaproteobacteria bacterium]|nr:SemiSWEET family sugar transporter [Alphaproteobacteria bacterium]